MLLLFRSPSLQGTVVQLPSGGQGQFCREVISRWDQVGVQGLLGPVPESLLQFPGIGPLAGHHIGHGNRLALSFFPPTTAQAVTCGSSKKQFSITEGKILKPLRESIRFFRPVTTTRPSAVM